MNSKRKYVAAIGTLLGSIVMLVAIYLFFARIAFLSHSRSSDAPIVAITHEYVPKGRGSVLAYVPTVEVRDFQGRPLRLKVNAFNEAPVYAVGQQMRVVCDPERGCIEDTFFAKWGSILINITISLVFFAPLLYYRLVPDERDPAASLLDL
jgi:hypothetical protein